MLIDAWRAPNADQRAISRQFGRAGDHLAKLLYAQMADYAIASQEELVRAIDRHRRKLYLDGPNDYDWIFRNDLLHERESQLYVDLMDSEGTLQWWSPHNFEMPVVMPLSVRLVDALLTTGMVSSAGLAALQSAWAGFDPHEDSHCNDWRARTERALLTVADGRAQDREWAAAASCAAGQWPMPMVDLDLAPLEIDVETLAKQREDALDALMRREYGFD